MMGNDNALPAAAAETVQAQAQAAQVFMRGSLKVMVLLGSYLPVREPLPLGLDLRDAPAHHVLMRMLIRHSDGSMTPAMLLDARTNLIIAAVPGSDDAVEYRWVNGGWFQEEGGPVEIDFDPPVAPFVRSVIELALRQGEQAPVIEPLPADRVREPALAFVN